MTGTSPSTARGATAARERRGLLAGFFAFGAFWGSWAAVLPAVRTASGLGDGALGLALGAVAVAALPAMPLAGRVVDRAGAGRLLRGVLVAFGAVCVLLGAAAGTAWALVVALLLLGTVTGVLDVGLNGATAAWERLQADRLLTAGHGCFSLGVLAGAVLTGLARDLGAGPLSVLTASGLLSAAAGLTFPPLRAAPAASEASSGRRRLAPVLLGLAAVVAASFLVEDAVSTWGALHLERTLDAPPWVSGLAPGLFAGAMAAGRLGAHALVPPGRESAVVGLGALGTGAGLLLLALAPSPAVGLVGATVAGAGVSVLSPTLMSAVGARSAPGRQGADLALVTAFGYTGFVLGPVLVGVLSAATSLPAALACLAGLSVVVALAGSGLLRAAPARSAA